MPEVMLTCAGHLHKPSNTPQCGQPRGLMVLTLHLQVDVSHVQSLPGPLKTFLQDRVPRTCTHTHTYTHGMWMRGCGRSQNHGPAHPAFISYHTNILPQSFSWLIPTSS